MFFSQLILQPSHWLSRRLYRKRFVYRSVFHFCVISKELVVYILKITGIVDLKSRRIATPLPARVSLLDDPLRVLRAIRFGKLSFISFLLVRVGHENLEGDVGDLVKILIF